MIRSGRSSRHFGLCPSQPEKTHHSLFIHQFIFSIYQFFFMLIFIFIHTHRPPKPEKTHHSRFISQLMFSFIFIYTSNHIPFIFMFIHVHCPPQPEETHPYSVLISNYIFFYIHFILGIIHSLSICHIFTPVYIFFIHSEETHRDSACTYQLTFSFIFNFKYFPRNTHSWFICHVYKDKSVVFHIYIHFLYIHTYVLTIFSRHKIHVRRQRGPKNLKGKSHHDSTNRVTLLLRPYSRPLPRALGRSWGGGGLLWARYPCIICRVWCIAACTALPRYKLNVRPSPLSIAGDAIHREIERSRPFS